MKACYGDDFAHSATSSLRPLLHIFAKFCRKQKTRLALFKRWLMLTMKSYKTKLTFAARTMLFGDWRAARSVRILFRSLLEGGAERRRNAVK